MNTVFADAASRVFNDRNLLKWGVIAVVAYLALRALRRGFWTLFGLAWMAHWIF